MTNDQSFTWEGLRELPEDVRPVGAYYTLRAHRPEVAEIDVDVLLHEPAGSASAWAATAELGGPLGLWGPRRLYHPLPTDDHLLLVGDETAIPAITAILESLDPSQRATAFIEVRGPDDELPIDAAARASVAWLHRGDDLARHSTLLLDAVEGTELVGQVYAWGGGEGRSMARVRRHLHDERGLDPSCTEVIAYWRQGATRAEVEQGEGDDGDGDGDQQPNDLTVRQVDR